MLDPGPGAQLVNSYALVSYLPDPLGAFLNRLRTELEPDSLSPRAHLTLLPPRELPEGVTPDQAWLFLAARLPKVPAPEVILEEVEAFEGTYVVYVAVEDGVRETLERMHQELNDGPLRCCEKFNYHPHVTIAQKLTKEKSAEVLEEASGQWSRFPHSKRFCANTFTFVRATAEGHWVDLYEIKLACGRDGCGC